MPSFGTVSAARLATCDVRLIQILGEVIPHFDFTVICGRRGEEAQNEAYRNGFSRKKWPNSQHNTPENVGCPAVDIAPWHTEKPHIRWNAEREFILLAGRLQQAANNFGLTLRWGGDWDLDNDLYDRNIPWDLGHFELHG
jgi:peptidoglycan L-alanyl-D-glutamate endopeptidase CwlK